ncbi:MAG: hypothetical protein WC050_02045 [Candidatus Paceibacterota bacterium]
MYASSVRASFVVAFLFIALAFPFIARAQESDLNSTIRASLASDPRTSGMSETQIDAMVVLLSQKAQQQGMTSSDITWRPQADGPRPTAQEACGNFPSFLCVINTSFGFDDTDYTIPIILGLTSLLLIFFIALFLERHHAHMRALKDASSQVL